jgi:hypothetical protein
VRRHSQQPKTASVTDRLIAILDRELLRAHAKVEFLSGKVERLELAMATFGNNAAKAYVDRSDAKPPIEEVAASEPVKKSWKQQQDEWAAMSDDEKQKVIDGKAAN